MEIMDKSKFVHDLFTDYSHKNNREELSNTMDAITERFGKSMISLGVCHEKREPWQMNQCNRSPAYLSNWSELFRVG